MIIFKFISTGIKQNLGFGCLEFYFRDKNQKKKKLYINIYIFLARLGSSFELPRLAVEPLLNLNI